jgi:uncharacterized protein YwqG
MTLQVIPAFLEKYKSQIEKYKLDTVRILAHPIDVGEELKITQSKFLGTPYIPISKKYPSCADGTPMIMLAQINFAEIPQLESYPTSGILQIFVHPTDWYDMSEYKILYHESETEEYHTDFSFITSNVYEESPIYCEHKLTFIKQTEYGGREDFRFKINFDGLDYFDFQETLPKEEQEQMDNLFYITGHKIGGYAYFTQSDPRDYDKKLRDDVLILQIDTDEKIMFGDSGVANVFININDLKSKDFDKAYFNWDCC